MINSFKSRPLFYVWISFSIGICAQYSFQFNFLALSAFFILLTAVLWHIQYKQPADSAIWLLLFLVLVHLSGALRLSALNLNKNLYDLKGSFGFEGYVFDYKNNLPVIRLKNIHTGMGIESLNEFAVIKYYNKRERFSIGDYIYLSGNIAPARNIYFNNFNYGKLLTHSGINYIIYLKNKEGIKLLGASKKYFLKRMFISLRNQFSEIIDTHTPHPYSTQIKALIFGIREEIPRDVIEDYQKTGTSHILAISGSNVALIAYISTVIFSVIRLKLLANRILTIAVLIIYCTLAGMSSSVVRATIIAVIFLSGFLIKRNSDFLNSIGAGGFLILLANPFETFKCDYLLSFAAVISIALFAQKYEKIYQLFNIHKLPSFIMYPTNIVLVSLSAWLGVIPIIAYFFKIAAPGGLIANIYTIPLTSLAIISGLCSLFAHGISHNLAGICGNCSSLAIQINNYLNHYLASINFMYYKIENFNYTGIAVYYTVFFLFLASISIILKKLNPSKK